MSALRLPQFHEALSSPEITYTAFSDLLSTFESTSLAQMEQVALLNRVDTKYVLSPSQLKHALASLTERYSALDIEGSRLSHYRTLYFDTPTFALYMRHHAGNEVRYKVRSRRYVDLGLSFLEVKKKTNKDRTIKKRIQTTDFITHLTPDTNDFITTYFPYAAEGLEPKLWNDYWRITLVSKGHRERLTLDLNLQFRSVGCSVSLPGIAIAEVKQDSPNRDSDFIREMRRRNIRPNGISKYCIGVSLLHPSVKHNNFKPKLRILNKIAGANRYA